MLNALSSRSTCVFYQQLIIGLSVFRSKKILFNQKFTFFFTLLKFLVIV